MANPYWDEHGDHNLSKKSTHNPINQPKGKQKGEANFKQHPCHTGPEADGKLPK